MNGKQKKRVKKKPCTKTFEERWRLLGAEAPGSVPRLIFDCAVQGRMVRLDGTVAFMDIADQPHLTRMLVDGKSSLHPPHSLEHVLAQAVVASEQNNNKMAYLYGTRPHTPGQGHYRPKAWKWTFDFIEAADPSNNDDETFVTVTAHRLDVIGWSPQSEDVTMCVSTNLRR